MRTGKIINLKTVLLVKYFYFQTGIVVTANILSQKNFYLNEKIFLAWHFLDECNAGDRRMIDVTDGGRAGPHPQSQID